MALKLRKTHWLKFLFFMLYNIFTILKYILTTFAPYNHEKTMAGIYIHIPFCKSRCIYCNFFSTTSLSLRNDYVDALSLELRQRSKYLGSEPVETIYFGGGTPSLLQPRQLSRILSDIYNIYNVRAKEITIECNPDDLAPNSDNTPHDLASELHSLGFNRISIGIQTLNDKMLSLLHRRHNSLQAIEAVHNAQAAGFDNISIDLMFGLPGQTLADLQADVNQALSLGIQHLSIYSLQCEEGTPLSQMLDNGTLAVADDELSRSMYEYILDATQEAGFQLYEISNFALSGRESLHNSNYWHPIPYLGVGAGAHSYNLHSRQSNPESLTDYIEGANRNNILFDIEELTPTDLYNEYVFTALRTRNGLNIRELERLHGTSLHDYCLRMAKKHIKLNTLELHDDTLRLTHEGLFISNDIMSDLMYIS